jgi:hypothetical protein
MDANVKHRATYVNTIMRRLISQPRLKGKNKKRDILNKEENK